MFTLWRLILSRRVKSPWRELDLHRWLRHLKRDGLTTLLRLELKELLAPKIVLSSPFNWGDDDSHNRSKPSDITHLVDWDLVLATDHVRSTLVEFTDESWNSASPCLLEDFQQLLRDALELLRELGKTDARRDRSHWDLPSITPHRQNHGLRDWVSLIELLRDAWLIVRANNRTRAARIAQDWYELPYPTFKRLALFAASQDDCIPMEQWVDWLLADDAWWLWSTDTGREVFRLFFLQGRLLAGTAQEHLETGILAGPPRHMYRDDLEPDQWHDLVARSVWLRLAKLNASGLILGAQARLRLVELSQAHPQWELAAHERDEFSFWSSGSGDPDFEENRVVDIAPRKRKELVQWLVKSPPQPQPFYEDTWCNVCRTRFFHSWSALCDLAQNSVWPDDRWREALQSWAETGMATRSWRFAAPLVQTMPDSILQEIVSAVSGWLEAVSKSIERHEDILLNLCRRVFVLSSDAGAGSRILRSGVDTSDPVGSAINHPVGQATQALINLCFKKNLNDNDLLPAELKMVFTELCDVQVTLFRHGRVLLGAFLIAFFRVDRPWTEQHLLPLFCWSNPVEAKAVWEGFLWSPRLYEPLLVAFKPQFLESANHYSELGEHRQQFATFLAYAALMPTKGYTVEEFRSAIAALPQDGLEKAAQAFAQALEGAADQREEYWKNRAQPFWKGVWPKSRDLVNPRIAESLSRLVVAAGGEFPTALAEVLGWLQPIEYPHYILCKLRESRLCGRFPVDALSLLNAIIAESAWVSDELSSCLDEIKHAASQLEQDVRYQRLHEYVRRRR